MTWIAEMESEDILFDGTTIIKESTVSLMRDLAQQVYWFGVNLISRTKVWDMWNTEISKRTVWEVINKMFIRVWMSRRHVEIVGFCCHWSSWRKVMKKQTLRWLNLSTVPTVKLCRKWQFKSLTTGLLG